ncbi:CoA ester lyase [Robbsia sp. Bb-Pol-6]|uniref:CoA ester lyase n=1 Tax=Robbsia betulipollinis TaxID=2981849 RepID=A0ABT3ZJU1_9BURK|nr:CoA ester lyase [Robbsia betulipollinis]MCY0386225.1 CoA ester lyase [Robbsia betulipollinis]
MKSKLFVPGSRPELFAKALAGPADAVSFDLEDAVAEAVKPQARAHLRRFLLDTAQGEARFSGKTVIVRVNPVDSPHFDADLAEIVRDGVTLLNLPKPRHPDDVLDAVRRLERAERANGVQTPIGLLLNIESPTALRQAYALASSHPRVQGLQLGLGDLFEPLGIARHETAAVQQAMFAMRMAAGEAGVFAYDAAFADIRDQTGFQAEARLAKHLGFIGKSCIHPSQVALANAVFAPTPDEIAHARRVVDAAQGAHADQVGAWVVDGKMIDAPFLARARAILAQAGRIVEQGDSI